MDYTGALPAVTLFQEKSYAGTQLSLHPGRYKIVPDLRMSLGSGPGSLRALDNITVTVFESDDFTGASETFRGEAPSLGVWAQIGRSLVIEVVGQQQGQGQQQQQQQGQGQGQVPPPAPTYGGTGPVTLDTVPPPPPAPAPPGPVPAPPGPVPAPPAPAPPWGTQAPPPQPARRDGWSRLDPSISYEVAAFKILSKGGVEVRVAVPFDVAVVGQALLSGFDFVLLGDEAEDAQRGFRLSGPGGAAVRLAARSFPGRRPGDLGLPAWVATMTLRGGVRLLSAQTLASLFGPDWAW